MIESYIQNKKIFLVMLGGKLKRSSLEIHDIKIVIGNNIKETYSTLKTQWSGSEKGLHIDSYMEVKHIDGYNIFARDFDFVNQKKEKDRNDQSKLKLWFINVGGYKKNKLSELHEFGLFVSSNKKEAKSRAKVRFLKGCEKKHIDNCLDVATVIKSNIIIERDVLNRSQDIIPDWFGYLRIDTIDEQKSFDFDSI